MIKKAVIWDLDGTLLDSYSILVNCVYTTFESLNIKLNKQEIYKYSINYSLTDYIKEECKNHHLNFDEVILIYRKLSVPKLNTITIMEHALETLNQLNELGVLNFVYTHKGDTTETVLKNNHLENSFVEVVNSLYGFKRKPDPEGINYLINKYQLDKQHTIYVGDRRIDIESANNANIKSILFNDKKGFKHSGYGEIKVVDDLLQIVDYFKKEGKYNG